MIETLDMPTSLTNDSACAVLILTAAVGGGHEALAGSIARELLESGPYTIITRDGPREVSRFLAWSLRAGYRFQLNHASWTIGPVFAVKTHPLVAPRLRAIYGRFYGRRLLQAIETLQPDLIISTYPIMTAVLDSLRNSGALRVPVVTAIADYGVHQLWVGPATTMHFVVSEPSRKLVQAAGGRATVVRMPVDHRFGTTVDKSTARAQLGLPDDRVIVLVAAGAWGVGDLTPAVRAAISAGALPVVITGTNEAARSHLSWQFPDANAARIVGWTGEMPLYLAAADCLIQNGGGMTCHEAGAVGIPVLFYCPLPGHGERNAETMEAAGVTWRLTSERAVKSAIERVAAGHPPSLIPRSGKPLAGAVAEAIQIDPSLCHRPVAGASRVPRAGFAAIILLALWLMFTPWTGGAVDFLMPPVANASTSDRDSVVLAIAVSQPASVAAIQKAAEQARTPVVIFVEPSAMAGVAESDFVQYGLRQSSYRAIVSHPGTFWKTTQDISNRIRAVNDMNVLYVLGSERGRTVAATALYSGPVRMFSLPRPPKGVVFLDLNHSSPAQAVERFQQELDRLAEEGLSCEFLPADLHPV